MLPAVLDMLIALVGIAIGLLASKLWVAERQQKPVRRLFVLCVWRTHPRVVCIGLIVLFVAGVVWKGVSQIREAKALSKQVVSGDTLLRAIPKGCPEDADVDERNAKAWNAKVETWKTETASWLGQAFADDLNGYQHECRMQWVRNRLVYFKDKLNTAVLARQLTR